MQVLNSHIPAIKPDGSILKNGQLLLLTPRAVGVRACCLSTRWSSLDVDAAGLRRRCQHDQGHNRGPFKVPLRPGRKPEGSHMQRTRN